MKCENEDTDFFIQAGEINRFYKTEVWEEDKFLSSFERNFDKVKTEFSSLIPLKPFKIIVFIWKEYREGGEESEEESEEESDEEPVINIDKSFKSDECVICLTNLPNVLFCNCGHLCLCEECDKVKSLEKCPVCKNENTIKRNIYN